MRRSMLVAFSLVLLLITGAPSLAEETPRVLLEKAVKAMGGEGALSRPLATHYVMRGKIPFGGKEDYAFTGEVFTQPNGDFKYAFAVGKEETAIRITMALVGEKGWRNVGGTLEDLDQSGLEEMKLGRYYDRVTSLTPILEAKGFTLESLPEIKVQGKLAVGVQVSSKGQPDIRLYFDKTTGLLIKTAYRSKQPGQDLEMLHENYYDDWREPDHTTSDEQTLKTAKLKTDGLSLLDFLRRRRPASGDAARIKELVEQLGDDSFDTREKATAALVAIGPPALPQLREAAEKGDTEVKRRAKACLKAIGDQSDEKLVAAAVRLVGWRKPDGAAEVLLEWAARLGDDALGREVRAALDAVAVVDGKPAKALLDALEDKDSARANAAAAALRKDGGAAEKKPGRRLYIAGLKFPMKAQQFQNGAKMLEREYTQIEFFNRFEEASFAKR
ncbi:MAG TPA: hypothetical protein VKE94_09660 [Gemmataceae bacterium]|nr:hypothetical protein [Gemmataceae bacterium]